MTSPDRTTTCPKGKKRFPSQGHAEQVLTKIWSRPEPGRRLETRTYQCPLCGYWHLTSKPAPEGRTVQ